MIFKGIAPGKVPAAVPFPKMYEKFFSLDELPFVDGLPDSRFYFVGSSQHQAMDLLAQNLSISGSICVLTGPSGSGKTTLLRMLIRSLPVRMKIITIDDPRLDPHMLLATILRASGVVATSYESIAELTLKLRKMLESSMENGQVTTVICDEAQGLSDEVIEQIRLISNIEGDQGKMINFLLAGQEELIEHIQRPEHQMFWGRVKAFATTPALKRDEVQAYVSFRLQQAGCHEPLFSQSAMKAVYRGSCGLPRLINSICDRALQLACDAGKHTVTVSMVRRAVITVRYRRGIFARGFKSLLKSLAVFILVKIPLLALGIACAAGTFWLAYHFLPRTLDSQSIKALIASDQVVQQNYQELLDSMLRGRNRADRERALFDISVSQACFKSDSVATLINLWGYSRRDQEKIRCEDLDETDLECVFRQGTFQEMSAHGRPAVLSLRDDSLTPFYAVLQKLENKYAGIILGDRLWVVKRGWLEQVYDGSYMYVRHVLPNTTEEIDLKTFRKYVKALQRQFPRDHKFADLQSRKQMKAAFEEFYGRFDNVHEAAAALDLAMGDGPVLRSTEYNEYEQKDISAVKTGSATAEEEQNESEAGAPAADAGDGAATSKNADAGTAPAADKGNGKTAADKDSGKNAAKARGK